MTASAIPNTGAAADSAELARTPAGGGHQFSFHDVLSAMNPLQYLPVVGTIYRALTGDVIPESVRHIGSMVVSGLLGGPVGVITYIASAMAQKATGIDPEKIIRSQFSHEPSEAATQASADTPSPAAANPNAQVPAILGLDIVQTIGSTMAASPAVHVGAAAPAMNVVAAASGGSTRIAWTPDQLASYGVRVDASGIMKLGDIEGADVLNSIELMQIRKGAAAYSATQSMAVAGR